MSDDDKVHIGALYLKLEEAGNIIERLEDKIKTDAWVKPKLIEYKNEIERLQKVITQLRTDNTRLRHSNDTSDR